MIVITALTWSVLAIALKVAIGFTDNITIVGFRFLVAFISLFVIMLIFFPQDLKQLKKPPKLAFLCSLCLGLNYIGFQTGISDTNPSTTQIFIQAGPLGLVLVGVYFFKEKLSYSQIFGFLVAVLGFYLFYSDQIKDFETSTSVFTNGILWVLFAAFCWIIFSSTQKILFQKNWSPNTVNLIVYGGAALGYLPFLDYNNMFTWNFSVFFLMVGLGLNTLIAYAGLAIALKSIPTPHVSIIIACNPILTLLFMTLLDHLEVRWITPDRIHLLGFLGAILVIVGVILVLTKPISLKKKTPPPLSPTSIPSIN